MEKHSYSNLEDAGNVCLVSWVDGKVLVEDEGNYVVLSLLMKEGKCLWIEDEVYSSKGEALRHYQGM